MKSWVKGGLIGAGIIAILMILSLFIEIFGSIRLLLSMPLLLVDILGIFPKGWIFSVLELLIIYFGLGALIGWLIGRKK